MTGTEQKLLAFVRTYRLEHGRAPSYAEIARGIGLTSASGVHFHVAALAERGALTFRPGATRSIELVPLAPVIVLELPTHLHALVQAVAAQTKVTAEAVVIECVRDAFAALRSTDVQNRAVCETSRGSLLGAPQGAA